MILGAKALAFLRGRDYVLPIDVRDLARDVLRHRVVLSYEGLADGVTADDLLGPVLEAVPVPTIPMRGSTTTSGPASSAAPGLISGRTRPAVSWSADSSWSSGRP
jgi:MoxR-like ATPase